MKKKWIEQIIKDKVFLAPMSGVTDPAFRIMARRYGAKFAFTEMIDVNGIAYNNKKTFDLMRRDKEDSPLGIQLVGQDEEKILFVARICQQRGFEVLDINAGCPARKVIKGGKGSALLKDPDKLASVLKKIVNEVDIPVTVKIRSGWDQDNLNYTEVVDAIQSSGIKAISVHPRTREQMYKGRPDYEIVRKIKERSSIPVFASGNIFEPMDVINIIELSGCDGVLIARGALGRPWIFREVYNLLNKKKEKIPEKFNDIKEIIIEHFRLCEKYYLPDRIFQKMYKHLAWYLKRYKQAHNIMEEYRKVKTFDDFYAFLKTLDIDEKNRLFIRF